MKQYPICIGLFLLAAIGFLTAQDKSPAIMFDSLEKDFGRVLEGEVLVHVFQFVNKGRISLEILEVAPS